VMRPTGSPGLALPGGHRRISGRMRSSYLGPEIQRAEPGPDGICSHPVHGHVSNERSITLASDRESFIPELSRGAGWAP